MNKKKSKKGVAEKIQEIGDFLKIPRSAEEIKRELKDRLGYVVKLTDVRINLLRLLRREKIKRKKEDTIYKYYV